MNSDYGLWSLVILNSAIMIFFAASFFHPHTKRDWRAMGGYSAFIVALFTETYGTPLAVGHVSVQVSAASGSEAARIVVGDDARAHPPTRSKAVFQRFHRDDPVRASHDGEGSGLGLTIARAIMTAHRGTLAADGSARPSP